MNISYSSQALIQHVSLFLGPATKSPRPEQCSSMRDTGPTRTKLARGQFTFAGIAALSILYYRPKPKPQKVTANLGDIDIHVVDLGKPEFRVEVLRLGVEMTELVIPFASTRSRPTL